MAGPIRDVRPKQSLRENAVRIVDQRSEEFLTGARAITGAYDREALHRLRIAAKRLRYTLTMFEVCFSGTRPLAREIATLQDDLGAVHDLDVLLDLLRLRLESIDAPLADRATTIAASAETRKEQMDSLRRLMYGQARDRRRLGLLALIGEKGTERQKRYELLREQWDAARLEALAQRIREVLHPVNPIEPEAEQPATA